MRIRSRWSVLVAIGALLLALVGVGPARAATPSAWYQSGYNQGAAGFNPNESTLVYGHLGALHRVWAHGTGEPCCLPAVAQVVEANGLAYYYSDDSQLNAVDAVTGATRWTATIPECANAGAPPAIHLGVLVVPSTECSPDDYNSYLSGLDPLTGAPLWSWRSVGSMSPPVTINGVAYVVSLTDDSKTRIDAIDVRTGAVRWEVTPGYGVDQLAADATHVYVSGSHTEQALSPSSGAVRWTRYVPGGDVLVSAGHVVFGSYTGGARTLTSFSTSGTRQWQIRAAGSVELFAATTTQLITGGASTVHAFALATGAAQWTRSVTGNVSAQPAIAGGVVYVPTLTGSGAAVFALHLSDGARLWTHTIASTSTTYADTAAVSIAAGTLFVSVDGTGVSAYRS